jgi:hypothetical protein
MQIIYVFCALDGVMDEVKGKVKRRGSLAGLWWADCETWEPLMSACNFTNVAWGFRLFRGMQWSS